MLTNIFFSIIETSLVVSVIAVLLFILKPIISKKFVVKWYYWAYLILFVRLLLPLSITLPQTSFNIKLPEKIILLEPLDSPVIESEIKKPKQNMTSYINPIINSTTNTSVENVDVVSPVITDKQISIYDIIAVIYGCGILIFLIYQLVCYIYLMRNLKHNSVLCEANDLSEKLQVIKKDMGIKRNISVYICSTAPSPMIAGFFKTVLLLPTKQYDEETFSFIFRHELIHYKRGDLWYKLLMLVANSLHWCNPIIYLLRAQSTKILELTCDNDVVTGKDIIYRKKYCDAIVDSINTVKIKEHEIYLSTSFNDNKKTLKQRFTSVFDITKRRKGIALIIILLILSLCLGLFFACGIDDAKVKNTIKPDEFDNADGVPRVNNENVLIDSNVEKDIETLLNNYFQYEADVRTKGVKLSDADFIELNAQMFLHCMAVEYSANPIIWGVPITCSYEYKINDIQENNDIFTVITDAHINPVNSSGVLYDDYANDTFTFIIKYIENELKIINIINHENSYQTWKTSFIRNVAFEDLTLEMLENGNFSKDYTRSYPKLELSIIEKETEYRTAIVNWDEFKEYIKLCVPSFVNYYKEPYAMFKDGNNVYLLARVSSPPIIYDYQLYLFKFYIINNFVSGELIGRIGSYGGFVAEHPEDPTIYDLSPQITHDNGKSIIFGRQPWKTIGYSGGTFVLSYSNDEEEQFEIQDGAGFIHLYDSSVKLDKLNFISRDSSIYEINFTNGDGSIYEYYVEKDENPEIINPKNLEKDIDTLLNKYFQYEADVRTKDLKLYDADFIEKNAQMYLHCYVVDEYVKAMEGRSGEISECSYKFTVKEIQQDNDYYIVKTDARILPVDLKGFHYSDLSEDTFIFIIKYINNELIIIDIQNYYNGYQIYKIKRSKSVAFKDLTLDMFKTDIISIDYSHSYPKTKLTYIEKETEYQTALSNWDEYKEYIKLCKPEFVNYYKEPLAMINNGDNIYLLAKVNLAPIMYGNDLYLFKFYIKDGYLVGETLAVLYGDNMPPTIPGIVSDNKTAIIFGRQPWDLAFIDSGTYLLNYKNNASETFEIEAQAGFIHFYNPEWQLEKIKFISPKKYIEYIVENEKITER